MEDPKQQRVRLTEDLVPSFERNEDRAPSADLWLGVGTAAESFAGAQPRAPR